MTNSADHITKKWILISANNSGASNHPAVAWSDTPNPVWRFVAFFRSQELDKLHSLPNVFLKQEGAND
jgi:hypothetical protein